MLRVILLTLGAMLTALPMTAQIPVDRGSRVRVTQSGDDPVTGVLEAADRFSLVVLPDGAGASTTFPQASISLFEVWVERSTTTSTGRVLGGILGAAAGGGVQALRAVSQENCVVTGCTGGPGPKDILMGAGIGMGAGILIGWAIGSQMGNAWQEIPLAAGITVRDPDDGGDDGKQ